MGDEILIRARGLCLERGGRTLLEGIDLDLRRGEHWLIWGPSGAGKTLLARLLAGLDLPSAGRLELPGDPPHPMLFQDPDAQLAAATVRDEVALGALRPRERPEEARRRVAEILECFRLAAFAGRNPHSLSGGEKRRLGLAALAALDAELLILDEPELHLDEISWRETLAALDSWHKEGPRLLLEISRDPDRALAADGILILREGRLVAAGPPREVYREHAAEDLPRVEAFEEAPLVRRPPSPSQTGETLLKARGLGLELPGGGKLFEDLDLNIARGEALLITGDNGSGKSTLLLLLADLADAHRGRIDAAEDFRAALAMQDPERAFFAETVEDEIAFAPVRKGLSGPEIDRRVGEAMAALGLDPALRPRDPLTLSAGEKRRVALASLLVQEPDLLLLDEPGAGLDPSASEGLVAALVASGRAFLWADCRPPAGLEDRFHHRYTLTGGKLVEVAP